MPEITFSLEGDTDTVNSFISDWAHALGYLDTITMDDGVTTEQNPQSMQEFISKNFVNAGKQVVMDFRKKEQIENVAITIEASIQTDLDSITVS